MRCLRRHRKGHEMTTKPTTKRKAPFVGITRPGRYQCRDGTIVEVSRRGRHALMREVYPWGAAHPGGGQSSHTDTGGWLVTQQDLLDIIAGPLDATPTKPKRASGKRRYHAVLKLGVHGIWDVKCEAVIATCESRADARKFAAMKNDESERNV